MLACCFISTEGSQRGRSLPEDMFITTPYYSFLCQFRCDTSILLLRRSLLLSSSLLAASGSSQVRGWEQDGAACSCPILLPQTIQARRPEELLKFLSMIPLPGA